MPGLIRLQGADAGEVFALLSEVYRRSVYPMGGSWTLRLIEKELENQLAFGLKEEGKILAVVLIHAQDGVWEIVMLATDPAHHRKGLMTRLMTALADQRPPKTELWLEVHEGNLSAQNLYKKLGFRQVGRRDKYYRDGGAALLYSLR